MTSQATPTASAARCPPWSRPGEAARLFARGATLRPCVPVAAVVGCVLSAINEGARIAAGHAGWPTWRGSDMALAEHYTPVHSGRLTAAALEMVTFDRPHRIGFRLVRGPVPRVVEEFRLTGHDGATVVEYAGELGTDFGTAGQWWASRVAASWEAAVRHSFAGIKDEAERRSGLGQ